MAVELSPDLKASVAHYIDSATQEDVGRDIDVLINEIAKTEFENLAKESVEDKLDKDRIRQIKFGFSVVAVALAVVAIIGAIATIIFAAGVFSPGTETLAIVTGFVGISTSFSQLDKAIYRYINYHSEEKVEKTRIKKLMKKIANVKSLITGRINTLEHIEEKALKSQRCSEILGQIQKVNEFVKTIKDKVPRKIPSFGVFDPSPLLRHV